MDIASINIIAIHSTALKFSEVVANNFSINFTEIKNNACAKINTVKRANPDSVTISFIDIEFTDETKLSVIIDIKEIITRGTVAANNFFIYNVPLVKTQMKKIIVTAKTLYSHPKNVSKIYAALHTDLAW